MYSTISSPTSSGTTTIAKGSVASSATPPVSRSIVMELIWEALLELEAHWAEHMPCSRP
jgi:hypothetical protein